MTEKLFLTDAYLKETTAKVVDVRDGCVVLDRTVFYAASGGQPGDRGTLGDRTVVDTVYSQDRSTILHVLEDGQTAPDLGDEVELSLDWDRRLGHMKMHTACHLLSVVVPLPVTGGSVGEADARLDFDCADPLDKDELTERMNTLIAADHSVYAEWIKQSELDTNPELVKSKNVRPPRGAARIRLVCIGADKSVDSQPCGGTHVMRTGEIGPIQIAKIEKKGRENRRIRLRLGEAAK